MLELTCVEAGEEACGRHPPELHGVAQQVRDAPHEAAEGGRGAAGRHGPRQRPAADPPPQLLRHGLVAALVKGCTQPHELG